MVKADPERLTTHLCGNRAAETGACLNAFVHRKVRKTLCFLVIMLRRLTANGLTLPSVYPGQPAGAAVVLTSWFTVRFGRLGQHILDREVLTGACRTHRPWARLI